MDSIATFEKNFAKLVLTPSTNATYHVYLRTWRGGYVSLITPTDARHATRSDITIKTDSS
jgi:hypothetical protein